MKYKNRIWLYIFIVVVTICGIDFYRFLNYVLNSSESNQKINTEAIIVLTGGQKRIETGIILLKNNPSKRLFITGIDSAIKKIPDLIKSSNLLSKDTRNRVEFGQEATTTFENALEAKKWLQHNKISSITLVTSAYHMPRSILAFKNEMPYVRVEYYSVPVKEFKSNKWWKIPGRMILIFKEYAKYSFVKTIVYIKQGYEKFIKTA